MPGARAVCHPIGLPHGYRDQTGIPHTGHTGANSLKHPLYPGILASVTIESTAALAAELGLLSKDVTLTADLLGQLHDGLSEIRSEPQAARNETRRRSLRGLPSQSTTTLPHRG